MPLNMGNVRPEFITILSVQTSDQARAGRMIPAVNGSPPLELSSGLKTKIHKAVSQLLPLWINVPIL